MPKPSPGRYTLSPVRSHEDAPPRRLRSGLYATALALGLALGAILAVVAIPRGEVVAEAPSAMPAVPPAVPALPIVLTVPPPVSIEVDAVPVLTAELLRAPSIEANPTAPVVLKASVAKVIPPKMVPPFAMKRMHDRTQADLLARIAKVPAVALDRTTKRAESAAMIQAVRHAPAVGGVTADPTLDVLERRADLTGLPFRRGSTCRITLASARDLVDAAAAVKHLDHERLTTTLSSAREWLRTERVPALIQVVMVQPERNRRALARHMASVEGKEASEALARIALFDPDPEVRKEAVASLQQRPVSEYLRALLRGFEFPWPVVAEHAAEALAASRRTEAVPELLGLLVARDPQAPYLEGTGGVHFVKEVVRVNHKFNCLMCHPPSFRATDSARAPVPRMRKVFQQGFGYSSASQNDTFVRADVTYLKQDYSVLLTGTGSGILAGEHRYDVFVRKRIATSADFAAALARKKAGPTSHQKAATFALRELTGQESGAGGVNWMRFARQEQQVARQR